MSSGNFRVHWWGKNQHWERDRGTIEPDLFRTEAEAKHWAIANFKREQVSMIQVERLARGQPVDANSVSPVLLSTTKTKIEK